MPQWVPDLLAGALGGGIGSFAVCWLITAQMQITIRQQRDRITDLKQQLGED